MVNIIPNPATNNAKILIDGLDNTQVNVAIVDMAGRIISEYNLETTSFLNTIDLNTSEFANGVYQVITTTDETTNVKKLVISK